MKILFWSLYHGQTGTTVSAIATSVACALKKEKKVLLLHNQNDYSAAEIYLNVDKGDYDKNKGIDAVMTDLRLKNIHAHEIGQHAVSLIKSSHLDFLIGTNYDHKTIHEDSQDLYAGIMKLADLSYDQVFMDAHSGQSPQTRHLMDMSDMLVVCVNQNKHVLSATKACLLDLAIDPNKVIVLVGGYDKESKLSLKNIGRIYGFKNLLSLPYNTGLRDAINNQKIIDYVYRNLATKIHDSNHDFSRALFKLVDTLTSELSRKVVK